MKRSAKRVLALLLALLVVATAYGYAAWWPSCSWFGEVIVSGPPSPDSKQLRIALTFDDGPDPTVTPLVLDSLRDAGVHATFFVVGERAEQHPELLKRIAAEGHSLGNHSFDHPALIALSRGQIENQISRTQEAIRRAVRRDPHWFRPPFGLRDPRVLSIARDHQMRTILWSASPRDWQEPEPEVIRDRVLADLHDGAIVLLHDGDARAHSGRTRTARALPALLVELAARGYAVVSLDELFATRERPTTAGGTQPEGIEHR